MLALSKKLCGPAGAHGTTVPRHVEADNKFEHVPVMQKETLMVTLHSHVLGNHSRRGHALIGAVQV